MSANLCLSNTARPTVNVPIALNSGLSSAEDQEVNSATTTTSLAPTRDTRTINGGGCVISTEKEDGILWTKIELLTNQLSRWGCVIIGRIWMSYFENGGGAEIARLPPIAYYHQAHITYDHHMKVLGDLATDLGVYHLELLRHQYLLLPERAPSPSTQYADSALYSRVNRLQDMVLTLKVPMIPQDLFDALPDEIEEFCVTLIPKGGWTFLLGLEKEEERLLPSTYTGLTPTTVTLQQGSGEADLLPHGVLQEVGSLSSGEEPTPLQGGVAITETNRRISLKDEEMHYALAGYSIKMLCDVLKVWRAREVVLACQELQRRLVTAVPPGKAPKANNTWPKMIIWEAVLCCIGRDWSLTSADETPLPSLRDLAKSFIGTVHRISQIDHHRSAVSCFMRGLNMIFQVLAENDRTVFSPSAARSLEEIVLHLIAHPDFEVAAEALASCLLNAVADHHHTPTLKSDNKVTIIGGCLLKLKRSLEHVDCIVNMVVRYISVFPSEPVGGDMSNHLLLIQTWVKRTLHQFGSTHVFDRAFAVLQPSVFTRFQAFVNLVDGPSGFQPPPPLVEGPPSPEEAERQKAEEGDESPPAAVDLGDPPKREEQAHLLDKYSHQHHKLPLPPAAAELDWDVIYCVFKQESHSTCVKALEAYNFDTPTAEAFVSFFQGQINSGALFSTTSPREVTSTTKEEVPQASHRQEKETLKEVSHGSPHKEDDNMHYQMVDPDNTVNVMAGPYRGAHILGKLKYGDIIEVEKVVQNRDGIRWLCLLGGERYCIAEMNSVPLFKVVVVAQGLHGSEDGVMSPCPCRPPNTPTPSITQERVTQSTSSRRSAATFSSRDSTSFRISEKENHDGFITGLFWDAETLLPKACSQFGSDVKVRNWTHFFSKITSFLRQERMISANKVRGKMGDNSTRGTVFISPATVVDEPVLVEHLKQLESAGLATIVISPSVLTAAKEAVGNFVAKYSEVRFNLVFLTAKADFISATLPWDRNDVHSCVISGADPNSEDDHAIQYLSNDSVIYIGDCLRAPSSEQENNEIQRYECRTGPRLSELCDEGSQGKGAEDWEQDATCAYHAVAGGACAVPISGTVWSAPTAGGGVSPLPDPSICGMTSSRTPSLGNSPDTCSILMEDNQNQVKVPAVQPTTAKVSRELTIPVCSKKVGETVVYPFISSAELSETVVGFELILVQLRTRQLQFRAKRSDCLIPGKDYVKVRSNLRNGVDIGIVLATESGGGVSIPTEPKRKGKKTVYHHDDTRDVTPQVGKYWVQPDSFTGSLELPVDRCIDKASRVEVDEFFALEDVDLETLTQIQALGAVKVQGNNVKAASVSWDWDRKRLNVFVWSSTSVDVTKYSHVVSEALGLDPRCFVYVHRLWSLDSGPNPGACRHAIYTPKKGGTKDSRFPLLATECELQRMRNSKIQKIQQNNKFNTTPSGSESNEVKK